MQTEIQSNHSGVGSIRSRFVDPKSSPAGKVVLVIGATCAIVVVSLLAVLMHLS